MTHSGRHRAKHARRASENPVTHSADLEGLEAVDTTAWLGPPVDSVNGAESAAASASDDGSWPGSSGDPVAEAPMAVDDTVRLPGLAEEPTVSWSAPAGSPWSAEPSGTTSGGIQPDHTPWSDRAPASGETPWSPDRLTSELPGAWRAGVLRPPFGESLDEPSVAGSLTGNPVSHPLRDDSIGHSLGDDPFADAWASADTVVFSADGAGRMIKSHRRDEPRRRAAFRLLLAAAISGSGIAIALAAAGGGSAQTPEVAAVLPRVTAPTGAGVPSPTSSPTESSDSSSPQDTLVTPAPPAPGTSNQAAEQIRVAAHAGPAAPPAEAPAGTAPQPSPSDQPSDRPSSPTPSTTSPAGSASPSPSNTPSPTPEDPSTSPSPEPSVTAPEPSVTSPEPSVTPAPDAPTPTSVGPSSTPVSETSTTLSTSPTATP
jgi:hypothetical protein